jgi:hypothetical protein
MRKSLFISILIFQALMAKGQTAVGAWSDHFVYKTSKCVAVGAEEVYSSTGSSILIYNKKFAELRKMSRINGLTETGVSSIAWSEEYKTLVIAYTSTNVDLLVNNVIYNIPDINKKYIPGTKEIYRIRTKGKYAYLACSFGIVVLDLNKKEVNDTWKPGINTETNGIRDIAFSNDRVFAGSDNGVFFADLSNQGLAYFGNWNRINTLPDPTAKFTSIIFSGNKLFANQSSLLAGGDQVYAIDSNSSLFSFTPGVYNRSIDNASAGFTISSAGLLRYFDSNGNLTNTVSAYGWGSPDIMMALDDNGETWIADNYSGLIRAVNKSEFTALTLPGPVSDNAFFVSSLNGKTAICGGATDASWNNLGKPLEVSVYENNDWASYVSGTILDPVRVLTDPDDNNHTFVATWGGGLLEYLNNSLVKQYNASDSPLQSVLPGRPYVRICGMAYDKSKNLWITQSGVEGSIKILKPDGSWIVNPLTINAPVIGDIIITGKGQEWIILPGGHGLFVFDDNKTPEVFSDDRSKNLLVLDTENQPVSFVYSIAEDLDGSIWIGTDQGPLIYYNPQNVFTSDLKASRIKIPRNDGTDLADYLLKTETITSIAVDGANRKWLATSASGAYLLSADGLKQLKKFTENNSPLISNSIRSMSLDNKTGEVWFGTDKGVVSYRGDATQGNETFSKVYTFPDPVREDYTGNVTITGLLRDTQIRITDISGNLVYSMVSDGGEATWDLKTYNGKRVSTGVYLVFCASSDGSQSRVTKMLVIK